MLRAATPNPVQLETILSNKAPTGETVTPVSGAGLLASREDHKHPRLSSATVSVLAANGEAAITFTREFTAMPAVICLLVEAADNQPVVFKVKSWTMNGANYAGCVIKGSRLQTLPSVLTLLTQLLSFNVAGGIVSGAQFCCVAIQPSS